MIFISHIWFLFFFFFFSSRRRHTRCLSDWSSDVCSSDLNYPNPFNPSTVISYSLPLSANVTIEIYNPLGALVGTIAKGNFDAGNHKIEFNGSNLASGLYIYSLKATSGNGNSFVSTKKMLLLK